MGQCGETECERCNSHLGASRGLTNTHEKLLNKERNEHTGGRNLMVSLASKCML